MDYAVKFTGVCSCAKTVIADTPEQAIEKAKTEITGYYPFRNETPVILSCKHPWEPITRPDFHFWEVRYTIRHTQDAIVSAISEDEAIAGAMTTAEEEWFMKPETVTVRAVRKLDD